MKVSATLTFASANADLKNSRSLRTSSCPMYWTGPLQIVRSDGAGRN